jgi:hypothetical protein
MISLQFPNIARRVDIKRPRCLDVSVQIGICSLLIDSLFACLPASASAFGCPLVSQDYKYPQPRVNKRIFSFPQQHFPHLQKQQSRSSRSNNTRSRRLQLCNYFTNPSQYPTTSSRKHALLNSHRCFERALHWCFGSDFDRYCYHNHHPHRHLVRLNCHCKYSLHSTETFPQLMEHL